MSNQMSFVNYPPPQLALLPIKERPTERITFYGANVCSHMELLASLVSGCHQMEIANKLLETYQTITAIARASTHELSQIKHLGKAGAARVKAAIELGRRLLIETPDTNPQITSPADAANLLQFEMQALEQEQVRVLILDTRNRVLDTITVYQGSLNTSVVRVGKLFKDAIRQNACAIIVAHNHPSGDPAPSPEDVQLTKVVREAGKLLDIELLGHVIIGQGRFTSLKERGLGF